MGAAQIVLNRECPPTSGHCSSVYVGRKLRERPLRASAARVGIPLTSVRSANTYAHMCIRAQVVPTTFVAFVGAQAHMCAPSQRRSGDSSRQ